MIADNRKKDVQQISYEFEALLSILFGKDYHQSCGLKTVDEWKALLKKIVNAIEKSMIETIVTSDKTLKDQLINICENLNYEISSSNEWNSVSEKAIIGLVKLILNLTGEIPNHSQLQIVNKPKHWKLNKYRQIIYSQSFEQKYQLIVDKAPSETESLSSSPSRNFLIRKLKDEFKDNHRKFIEWYKSQYPDKYHEIF